MAATSVVSKAFSQLWLPAAQERIGLLPTPTVRPRNFSMLQLKYLTCYRVHLDVRSTKTGAKRIDISPRAPRQS
jgi:hypothetical protein